MLLPSTSIMPVIRLITGAIAAALVCLVGAGTGWAQAVAGSQVSGVVRDSSGGVLPGVEVTITKTDTGAPRTVFTGPDGAYVFPNLPVGPYRLKVTLQGFNAYVQENIVLQVNTNPTIDVTLTVGNVGEQVTVTAQTATASTSCSAATTRDGARFSARRRPRASRASTIAAGAISRRSLRRSAAGATAKRSAT